MSKRYIILGALGSNSGRGVASVSGGEVTVSISGTDDQSEQQQGQGALGSKLRESFDESSGGHGRAAAIAFLLFVLAYTPCLATVAELKRQFGGRVAAGSVALGLAVAYVLAVVAFQLLRLVM